MTKDEALKLALEALENSIDLVSHEARNAEELYGKYPTRLARIQGLVAFEVAHEKAIAALRQALANEALDKMAENARDLGLDYEPAQQEPFGYFKAEPFGWTDCAESDEGAVALYERPQPAQRTWVGLTDEEILAANYPDGEENGPTISAPDFELDCFAKQVEAKLKEKNA